MYKKCLILLQELKVRLDPGARLAQMQQGLKAEASRGWGQTTASLGGGESFCFGVILYFGVILCFGTIICFGN